MYLYCLLILPLLGSLYAGFGGFWLGRKGAVLISTINIFSTFLMSVFLFYQILCCDLQYVLKLAPWIDSGFLYCNWSFMFDSLTVVMLVVVTGISTLVHLYSCEYMKTDPHLPRFMAYLSLFTFFMLILVTADNFVQMFVGWEGVGLCSYLLINFWFTRLQANKAALKAIIVNRIGDFALIIGLLLILTNFCSLEYSSVFGSIPLLKDTPISFWQWEVNLLDAISFFLLIGAMGKSAQIFLHTWLPDAMEGPTPVSALIHAATMVTAGIFLISRCSPIFEMSTVVLGLMVLVGAMTAFFAGMVGLTQNDLKKVIAYSTCSQLGYMLFACGLSNYNVSVFHLSNHAFFKALLFLGAGSVIHAMDDEQDMRKMGGLRRILPFTYSIFIIGSLALMGFPFLTGFYSKDPILEVAFANHNTVGHFSYWLGTMAAFCTAFYSMRLLYLTFLTQSNSYQKTLKVAHESPFFMSFPLGILAVSSIFVGYISKDLFIGLGTNFWNNAIFIDPLHVTYIDAEFLPTIVKLFPVVCSLLGFSLAFTSYYFYQHTFYIIKTTPIGVFFYTFFNRKWFFDKVYNEVLSAKILHIGYFTSYKLIDRGLLEIFGPYGLSILVTRLSKNLTMIQTGYVYNYSLLLVLGLLFSLGCIVIQVPLSWFFVLLFLV